MKLDREPVSFWPGPHQPSRHMLTCGLLRRFGFREIRIQNNAGRRLDVFLAQSGIGLNWGKAHSLIKDRAVFIKTADQQKKRNPSYQLRPDDTVCIREAEFDQFFEKWRPLERGKVFRRIENTPYVEQLLDHVTVARTDDYLIINKPPGMFSQGTPTLKLNVASVLNSYFQHFKIPKQAYIVHRLDLPVSGLMLVATNKAFAGHFGKLLKERKVEKIYECLVQGVPRFFLEEALLKTRVSEYIGFDQGRQKAFLGNRDDLECNRAVCDVKIAAIFSRKDQKWVEDPPNDAKSRKILHRRVRDGEQFVCRLLFSLKTGKRHQIRVVCAEVLQSPILFDFRYGYKGGKMDNCEEKVHRILTAETFKHSDSNEVQEFMARAYDNREYIYLQSVRLKFEVEDENKVTEQRFTCQSSAHFQLFSALSGAFLLQSSPSISKAKKENGLDSR